jgi:tRNA threonylcarbamoyladenosine biosynthesis protein TsaE
MDSFYISKHISKSPEDTIEAGKLIGKSLHGGEIIFLKADLGVGKTCFTKGLAIGLNIGDIITSPSFAIMNIYEGVLTLLHLDLYRLNSLDELLDLGIDDYINSNSIMVIEWGDRFINEFPDYYAIIEIKLIDKNYRKITITKKKS